MILAGVTLIVGTSLSAVIGASLGAAIGWLVRNVQLHRHLAEGFHHLSNVSGQRALTGADLYTAFGWPARQHRTESIRRHHDGAAHRSSTRRP